MTNIVTSPAPRGCSTPGCAHPHLAKGLCTRCYANARYKSDPERGRQIKRAWVAKNVEKVSELRHANNLKRSFGMTVEVYNRMLEIQGGRCAICRGTDPRGGKKHKRMVVDHDHKTGEIRGLLCRPCNSGIGLLQDSEDVLRAAIEYLGFTR